MEKRVSILLVCLAISTLAISTTSKANLLADPGAEQELSAPNPNPTGLPGWSFFNGAQFLTTPNAHTGTNVIYTPDNGGGYSVPGAFQNFTASAGQTYTLSGWVYTPNVLPPAGNDFAILQLQFWSDTAYSVANGGAVGVNIGQPAGGGGVPLPQGVWTFASVTATAPAGTQGVSPYALDINASPNADFYFDDLSLTIVPEPSTVAMALTGLLGLVAFAKKRRV
jgi:hypothetical protein